MCKVAGPAFVPACAYHLLYSYKSTCRKTLTVDLLTGTAGWRAGSMFAACTSLYINLLYVVRVRTKCRPSVCGSVGRAAGVGPSVASTVQQGIDNFTKVRYLSSGTSYGHKLTTAKLLAPYGD